VRRRALILASAAAFLLECSGDPPKITQPDTSCKKDPLVVGSWVADRSPTCAIVLLADSCYYTIEASAGGYYQQIEYLGNWCTDNDTMIIVGRRVDSRYADGTKAAVISRDTSAYGQLERNAYKVDSSGSFCTYHPYFIWYCYSRRT